MMLPYFHKALLILLVLALVFAVLLKHVFQFAIISDQEELFHFMYIGKKFK